jgi:hypothetical protein
MNQRGKYGSLRVGVDPIDSSLPWKVALGGAIAILGITGIGYALIRETTSPAEWPEGSVPKIRTRARAAGIEPWMSKDETERLWRVYNEKHGRPSTAR